jgi:hypothetical protein
MQSWHNFNPHQESKMLLQLSKSKIKSKMSRIIRARRCKLEYRNESKTHSQHVANLEKHCGNVYALIYGQCTQILQDKMKQDKNWATVSVSCKPLELYKLIEPVILKQMEDQYPVAALWEQLSNVANAKQGNSTNNEWYDRFNTKM